MGSHFLPRLVNGPFDDPALFVPFRHEKRALLFDLGDISPLSGRDVLKLSHLFVTHTHMDHFCGFDRVLRLLLGREKTLHLFGPQGFLANVSGKLAGYCWNLVENYTNHFTLHAVELHPDRALCCSYSCRQGFRTETGVKTMPFDGVVIDEPSLTVRTVHLDHGIPVLAFRLDECFHVNVIKASLDQMNLTPGPWLNRFKAMLYARRDPNTPIDLPGSRDGDAGRRLSLKELTARIARITPGQQLAYIADAAGTADNLEKIEALADGVDHLFIEAAFSHRHRAIAGRKHHLTARQAGRLARRCRAKQYSLFHFSPRYTDCPDVLAAEAADAYSGD